MSVIPEGITHLEVTDNGANFWSITEPDDGTGEVWLGGKWMASEISDRLMQRLISFTPLQRPEPWGPNDIIPLGEGSITGEAYRRGVEAGLAQVRRTPIKVVADVSGGALYGVYAEVPVRVLFISDDADDVSALEESLGEDGLHRDPNGNLIASWCLASDGGTDAEMVQHYFEQE